jgi:CheY-like chemotaxis protein
VTKTRLLIAVVDDEEPIRKALMWLMRSAGMNVEAFASGAEFLKSLDTRVPDCVVLDLHMPHMNGFYVQAHLARKYAALPVIILPVTIRRTPASAPWRAAHQFSFPNQRSTALFLVPFLPRPRPLNQEVPTANNVQRIPKETKGKQTKTKQNN